MRQKIQVGEKKCLAYLAYLAYRVTLILRGPYFELGMGRDSLPTLAYRHTRFVLLYFFFCGREPSVPRAARSPQARSLYWCDSNGVGRLIFFRSSAHLFSFPALHPLVFSALHHAGTSHISSQHVWDIQRSLCSSLFSLSAHLFFRHPNPITATASSSPNPFRWHYTRPLFSDPDPHSHLCSVCNSALLVAIPLHYLKRLGSPFIRPVVCSCSPDLPIDLPHKPTHDGGTR